MEFARLAFIILGLGTILSACERKPSEKNPSVFQSQQFHDYWHAGKAEVSSYALNQSRYGETRKGKAVMIFVTEDLSKKLQVKLDDPDQRNKINVLKLNYTKKFITGIYPYSLMLSVFTPTDLDKEPATLKTSMSSQEWCGQVYMQMNLRGTRYAVKAHSYFEEEADQKFSVRQALLEDEIWNRIRLDHENLPIGDIKIIPGLFYTRLHHVGLKIRDAEAERTETDSSFVYQISYPDNERSITIEYEKSFPHKILAWTETWQQNGKVLETSATLDETLYTDYWNKNANEYQYLRDSLNLPNLY